LYNVFYLFDKTFVSYGASGQFFISLSNQRSCVKHSWLHYS